MESVVYILGAGFSAPLGIPVISNFLERSKDQYFAEPAKFEHFKAVFETINHMARAKTYYATDLLNIEDILSILEMNEQCDDTAGKSSFIRYLKDVVTYYTQAVPSPDPAQTSWPWRFVPEADPWRFYVGFAATLLNLEFEVVQGPSSQRLVARRINDASATYGVISLNYDLVLESMAAALNNWFRTDVFFQHPARAGGVAERGTPLSKLHGSVEREIIAPTWNKTVAHPDIAAAWKEAFRLLSEANHIRVLGYSLPTNDSYVRFLLRAAAMRAPHLKRIDVLCLDPDGEVEKRFREFITYRDFRFSAQSIEKYLSHNFNCLNSAARVGEPFRCDKLEQAHREIFGQ